MPREDGYPELWWILLVSSNAPNAAQGLAENLLICPYLCVKHCDGSGGMYFSLDWALEYVWNFECWGFHAAMLVLLAGFLTDLILLKNLLWLIVELNAH